jgi:histidine triad (HIT) family protein
MSSCLFCRIVAGAEPAIVVHRDPLCMAFMDIHPLAPGHVLLIPTAHAERLDQLDHATRRHLYRVMDALVAAQRRAGLGVEGSQLIVNDGKAANQHIPHVHLHLVPRRRGDSIGFFWRVLLHFTGIFGPRTREAELQAHADAIAAHWPAAWAEHADDALAAATAA